MIHQSSIIFYLDLYLWVIDLVQFYLQLYDGIEDIIYYVAHVLIFGKGGSRVGGG